MKKHITLYIISISFGLTSCASISAQEVPNRKYENHQSLNVNASGTHFDQAIIDKSWKNSNGKNYSKASFKEYNGGSFVNFEIKNPVEIEFHHVVQLNAGAIEFNIMDENQNFYNDHITSASNHIFKIKFDKPGNYKIHWTGTNADGNYFIEWKETN